MPDASDAQLEPMRPEPGHVTTTVAAIGSPFRSGHIAWRRLDPSTSEAWGARTYVGSSRHVGRRSWGPIGWMREAVLLSLEFELDVVDGTPEPILAWLIRLHDRMSRLAGVCPRVAAGRIVAAADMRAGGASTQVNPGPTIAQAVDAPRATRVLRRDRIQVRADVGHRSPLLLQDPWPGSVSSAVAMLPSAGRQVVCALSRRCSSPGDRHRQESHDAEGDREGGQWEG